MSIEQINSLIMICNIIVIVAGWLVLYLREKALQKHYNDLNSSLEEKKAEFGIIAHKKIKLYDSKVEIIGELQRQHYKINGFVNNILEGTDPGDEGFDEEIWLEGGKEILDLIGKMEEFYNVNVIKLSEKIVEKFENDYFEITNSLAFVITSYITIIIPFFNNVYDGINHESTSNTIRYVRLLIDQRESKWEDIQEIFKSEIIR